MSVDIPHERSAAEREVIGLIGEIMMYRNQVDDPHMWEVIDTLLDHYNTLGAVAVRSVVNE